MSRAFISLYLFIVLSVVLIGWGLDRFWESLAPQQEQSAEITDLITLLNQQLIDLSPEQQSIWLAHTNPQLRHRISFIDIDDLANTSIRENIMLGERVAVAAGESESWYQRVGQSDQILVLQAPIPEQNYPIIYSGLLIIFYLAIAVVIFLWIWPLSRGLSKLEKQTRHIGRDGNWEPLAVAPGSTIYSLANAFNKMSQRIRELINSHKEMTYAVSHELRTPLARMKFAVAMSEAADSAQAHQQSLRGIRQDILEMESLINSLLLYAGFEQSSGQLDRRDGHMKELLDELLARTLRDQPKTLTIELIDRSPGAIFNCEWKLMETVLQNLIQNAARFARQRIQVELAVTAADYQLVVDDDGPGIPAADRDRVFDSFVRLANEEVAQASGFGLGLAIVRRIVHWHGGSVTLEDSPLGGARFVVRWARQ
jgi:two-component system OmpR family sensor kinase